MKNPLKFIQDVKQEAFKVTWPTGKETCKVSYGSRNGYNCITIFITGSSFKVFLELILKVSLYEKLV